MSKRSIISFFSCLLLLVVSLLFVGNVSCADDLDTINEQYRTIQQKHLDTWVKGVKTMFEATVEYHKMALLFEMGGIEGQIKAFTDSNPLLSGPEKVQRISEIIAAAPVRFKVKGISYAGIDADDVFAKTIKDVGHQLDSLSASGIATSDIKLLDKQFEKIGKTVATRIADTMDGVPITIGDIDNLDVRGLSTVKREALKGFFTDLDDIRIGLPENLTSPKWTTYSGKILTAAGGILDGMQLASSTYTIASGAYTVQDVWNASSSIVGLASLCSKAAGKVAGPIAVVDAARTNTEQWVKLASLLEDSRDWETTIFDPDETYLNPLQMQEFYTDMANRYVSEITLEFRALEDAVAQRNLELMTARIMNLYRLRDLAREFKNSDTRGYLRNFSWTAWLGFSVTPGVVNSFDDILDPKVFDIDTIFLLYRTKLLAEEYKDAVARLSEYQSILNQHIPSGGTNTISSILYLTVPVSEAANFDVNTNQFTAKAGDKISLAYYNSYRPGGFSEFTGNISVYLNKHSGDACPGNARAGDCVINNDLLGQADAVVLQDDGSIDIIIPVDGRYSVRGFGNRVDGVNTKGISAPAIIRLVEADADITDPDSDLQVISWGSLSFRSGDFLNAKFKAIAVSQNNLLALKEDGTVVASGNYDYYGNSNIPTGLVGVKAIADGGVHALALKEDGRVVAWGSAYNGALNIPAGLTDVKAIAAGQRYSLALKDDSTVVAWGANNYAQCNVPGGLTGVKAIAAGRFSAYALKEDGAIVAWGSNSNGALNVPAGISSVKAIAAGDEYALALKEDGTVVAWGRNDFGQCNIPAGLTGVKAIAAGGHNSLALKEDGTVVAWGWNYGQYNVPTGLIGVKAIAVTTYRYLALKEDGTIVSWGNYNIPTNLANEKSIASNWGHSMVLNEDGTVVAWGSNSYGESNIPTGLAGVKAIAAGTSHSLALKEDGTIVAWGSNSYGESNIPTGLASVKAIAAGDEYALALKEDGTVVAWGRNDFGQCNIPAGLTGVKAIAAGRYFALALKEDGTVVAWGGNDFGQRDVPAGLTAVRAIAAGSENSLALKEDGTVVAWGRNDFGQCNIPAGLTEVKTIAAGGQNSLALKENGRVVAWGSAYNGALNIPAGLTNVKAIAAGSGHSLAIGEIVTQPPAYIHFLSENLPDGTYQIGSTTKTWKFHNGDTTISGLKAVPVIGRTDAGLGITASEIMIGDVAANTDFTVSLPIAPVHGGAPIKSSYWKLIDGFGVEVKISNSRTNQFWLKLRTNLAPTLSPLQLDSIGAQVGQTVSLPIIVSDDDGDVLIFTASSGNVNKGKWSGSFSTPGVHAVTLTVTDTVESASKVVYVVVRDEGGTSRSFTDVSPDSTAAVCDPVINPGGPGLARDYADIEYLFLHGVTIGMADGANRKFEPCRYATQAEALKLLMMAAHSRHGLVFDEVARPLANLIVNDPDAGVFINASWATPYVLKAEALGIIPSADTFSPQAPATRAWLARVVTRLQSLVVPVDALSGDTTLYQFPDRVSFANDQDYNDALAAAFFGYMGQLGSAFNPGDAMIRADVARVASRLLRAPWADDIAIDGLSPAVVAGRNLPAITKGSNFQVKGMVNLASNRILRVGDTIKEEWIDPPSYHVKGTIVKVGQGIVSGGQNVLVKDLATAPVTIGTATPPANDTEIHNLLAVLEDVDSGVRSVVRKDYAIIFPDNDGDGVRDGLDIWPDNLLFSTDANGNGIPDNADRAFNLTARNGAELITINGVQATIIQALLDGKFRELAEVLGLEKIGSTTTIVASPNSPGLTGQSIKLTVSVSGLAGKPAGSVVLMDGSTNLGTLPLDSNGQANLIKSFSLGQHILTASYKGDSDYLPSQSNLNYLVVSKISTTISMSSNPNPSQSGQNVNVTVNVIPVSNVGPVSGTVIISGDGQNCNITLPANSCTLAFSANGIKTLTASYSGDRVYAASTGSSTQYVGTAQPSITPMLMLLLGKER